MLTRIIQRSLFNFRCKSQFFCKNASSGTIDTENNDNAAHDRKESSVARLLQESTACVDTKSASPDDVWSSQPYASGTVFTKQDDESERPKIDPQDTSIILFPGQGSQYVGMAKNLTKFPEARYMFEYASEILGYDLLKLCNEGPEDKLNQTVYCQPAVMVTSLAALEGLKEERPNAIENCMGTAGFSLGEITALVFAGALPFDQAVRLVQIRAEAMQLASEENRGGMATIIFGPDSQLSIACKKAKEWCIDSGVKNPECVIANHLFPHCKVIAGSEEALNYIEANLKKYKLRKMKRIATSGAFHSSLMESAVQPFTEALKKIQIENPIITVHSNVTGQRYTSSSQIRKLLPKQIVQSVKWEQTMHSLYGRNSDMRFPRSFICGPGKALKVIIDKVNAKAALSAYTIN